MANTDLLKAELKQAKAAAETARKASEQARKVQGKADTEVRRIQGAITAAESPFQIGDIVVDETGTRFRITSLRAGYPNPERPTGIRLQKSGAEAHKDPRTIFSNKLTVETE